MKTSINYSEQLELTNCPLCSSSNFREVRRVDDDRHYLVKNRLLAECIDCTMIYLRERVPYSHISKCYPSDYISFQIKPRENPKSFRDKLFNFLIWNLQDEKIRVLQRFLRNLKQVNGIKLNPEMRLFDIGCGPGLFLEAVKKAWNCNTYGIDMSKDNIEYAKKKFNLNVEIKSTDELFSISSQDKYDIITLNHFLEHEYYPHQLLKDVAPLLKKNGLLLLFELPYINSFCSSLFGKSWFHHDCPRHTLFFTPKTINTLLREHGFVIESLSFPYQARGWCGSFQKFFKIDLWSKWHKNLYSATLLQILCMPLTIFSCLFNKGDEFTVIARKYK